MAHIQQFENVAPILPSEFPIWFIDIVWKYNADFAYSKLEKHILPPHPLAFTRSGLSKFLIILKRIFDDYQEKAFPINAIIFEIQSLGDFLGLYYRDALSAAAKKSMLELLDKLPGFISPKIYLSNLEDPINKIPTEHYNFILHSFILCLDAEDKMR